MKNQILDTPFRDSFSDFLEKGETVVWKGQPKYSSLNSFKNGFAKEFSRFGFPMLMIFMALVLYMSATIGIFSVIYILLALVFFFLIPWWKRNRMRKITYAVTQQQILFQFKSGFGKKSTCYAVPFSEIKDVIVTKKYDFEKMRTNAQNAQQEFIAPYNEDRLAKIGTIFLVPHHPQLIPFETKNLDNNEKRHSPTLELLEDVEAIGQLIREGIRKNVN